MTYGEVRENARKTILNCRACPECNGLGCGNTLPGPGSKAPGNGAHVNWQAWKDIRLMETAPTKGRIHMIVRSTRLPVAITSGDCVKIPISCGAIMP